MPNNLVHNKREEKLWSKAKSIVREDYPSVKEGSDRWYKLVNGIYQDMLDGKKALAAKK